MSRYDEILPINENTSKLLKEKMEILIELRKEYEEPLTKMEQELIKLKKEKIENEIKLKARKNLLTQLTHIEQKYANKLQNEMNEIHVKIKEFNLEIVKVENSIVEYKKSYQFIIDEILQLIQETENEPDYNPPNLF